MSDGSDSDDCEDMPTLVCHTNGGNDVNTKHIADDAMEDGDEMYVDSLQPALDLFSTKKFKTAEDCLDHCKDVHGLDLSLLKKRHSMDTFSYIRFINYVRTETPSPGFVMSLSGADKWSDVKFMKPVIEDDPLLMFNFEEDFDWLMLLVATVQHHRVKSLFTILSSSLGSEVLTEPSTKRSGPV